MKDKVLNLKENIAIVTYLQMLQGVISRMNNNSCIIKSSFGVIYTIIMTLLYSKELLSSSFIVVIMIICLVIIIDGYYLSYEKMYRYKYNTIVENLNKGYIDSISIYDMKPQSTKLKYEIVSYLIQSVLSFSVVGYYGMFIIITLIIK